MNLKTYFNDNLPSILTGVAVAGVVETVYLAVKATPKACRVIDEMEKPTRKEVVKETWKLYLPAAVAGAGTIMCIISANHIHLGKEAGLAAVCTLMRDKFAEYRENNEDDEAVMETIKKKHAERAGYMRPEEKPEPGKMWCYEPESDQFFQATTEQILWAELTANKIFANQGALTFNQFLDLLPGAKKVLWGDHFGWYITDDDGTWDFNWSFYRGTPWIDIQPQIAVDQDMMILAYGMHPGDETDPHDLEEPEQFEVKGKS